MAEDILYIIIPAYNEEKNIENTITEWYPIIESHSGNGKSGLIIFNDGSSDKTSKIVKNLISEKPLLKIIDKKNSGHGPTLIEAYDYAIKKGGGRLYLSNRRGWSDRPE